MSRSPLLLLLIFVTAPAHAGGGHVYNENFSVLTPERSTPAATQDYASQLLVRAERYRTEIAREWLGAELPAGVGRTLINVKFSAAEDAGLTWAGNGRQRPLHNLYLATTPERALGTTLKHEMCHVVFATRFPQDKRLPSWIEEGIASRYDDKERSRSRQQLLRWWLETSNWPNLERVFADQQISGTDRIGYTVASSVVEFLIGQRTKATLLEFAQAAQTDLPAALRLHYQIRDLDELDSRWRAWVQSTAAEPVRVAGVSQIKR